MFRWSSEVVRINFIRYVCSRSWRTKVSYWLGAAVHTAKAVYMGLMDCRKTQLPLPLHVPLRHRQAPHDLVGSSPTSFSAQ